MNDLEHIMRELHEELVQLTALDGVSGHEQEVIRAMREKLGPHCTKMRVDPFGNLLATAPGIGGGLHLMVCAHADEIGLVVKSIGSNGFLRFSILGGAQPALLPGRLVRINGRIHGVIGTKSGHLRPERERYRVPHEDELYIDVGAGSAEEVAAMGIRVGDPVAFVSPLVSLNREWLVCGKAIDDRLGCAVLLAFMRRLPQEGRKTTVTAAITTQEEVGLRGASVAAYTVAPDCAIIVDTFMSGDTPDVDWEKEMPVGIGRGPVHLLASGAGLMGNIAHPAMVALLEDAAADADVPIQRATVVGKAATDAATVHMARGGIPTGGIGLPRRYSHSPVCTCDLADAARAVLWLLACLQRLEGMSSLSFLDE